MVLHDISMWFSSKEPVLDKTISRVNRCNGDKLASLEEALRNDNSLYQSGYFWCADHILFLSDNIIKSGKYDWSLCYVSVGGSIFKAHTVDWVVNEGRQATVEKNSNFWLIWSEARWGVVLLQLSRLSIVILMNWLRDSCSATQSWTVEILQIGLSLNA